MGIKKTCKYEESIIGQIMDKKTFNNIYLKMINLKLGNNIRLTPQETKDYIELKEEQND